MRVFAGMIYLFLFFIFGICLKKYFVYIWGKVGLCVLNSNGMNEVDQLCFRVPFAPLL